MPLALAHGELWSVRRVPGLGTQLTWCSGLAKWSLCRVPSPWHTAKWPNKSYFFWFFAYKGPHITTYISQALHITYISQQTSQALYITIYISQLATNNFKHIQKSNAKSCKFTTYPELHKYISRSSQLHKYWNKVVYGCGGPSNGGGPPNWGGNNCCGSVVRCPATSLAYSMTPIDSAKNIRQ